MKVFYSIIIVIFSLSILGAQTKYTQKLKGVVIDKQSQYPLIGVNVVIEENNTLIGAATDLNGEFVIDDVALGRHTVVFTLIGYDDIVVSNILLQSAKELILNIEMIESMNKLDEIVITADADKHKAINEMAAVSIRTLSVEEMGRFSGSLADPARMAQSFAGVSGASDSRNDIIIRGNSPTGVIWRMEGVDIPSPNHFSTIGTTGGPVSMLNLNNLRNSDFITSAFPAEYGNGTSGVFDLKLKNGNTDNHEFIGQIGFNGFELGVEGPLGLGDRSSFIINYRHSTLEVLDILGLDIGVGSAVPQYKDLTFKFNIPTEKYGRFSFWGVGGLSHIEFIPDPDSDNVNLFTQDNEETIVTSNTGFSGMSHTYFFNENTYSKLDLVISETTNDITMDTLGRDGSKTKTFSRDLVNKKLTANWKLNKKLNVKDRVMFGLVYDHYIFNYIDSVRLDNDIYDQVVSFDGNLDLLRSYVQWQHRQTDKLTINMGLHAMRLFYNKSNSIEPRLSLRYETNDKNKFNLGFGILSQMQPLPIYFQTRVGTDGMPYYPNESLEFFKSIHTVAGWDHIFNKNLQIKIETYYQYLYNVAVDQSPSNFSMINTGADFGFPSRVGLDNDGTGYNYGVELTVERFFDNQYYYLLTGSVYDSKFKGSNGITHSTLYNGNYVFNALGGKEFNIRKNLTISLDSKLTFAGGKRYTPINLDASRMQNEIVYFEDQSFDLTFDPYFRLDFKISLRQNAKRFSQSWSVDLQNLTNQKNVFLSEYNKDTGAIEIIYQRGFFPDSRYQIWF